MSSVFFFATKLFWLVIAPDMLWLELLILAFLLSGTRFRRLGRMLAGTLLVFGLVVAATKPAQYLAQPLENRFPHPSWPGCVHGILMLGGGEDPLVTAARGLPEITDGAPRLMAAAELLRRYPEAQLIFSGGSGDMIRNAPPETETIKAALEQMGADLTRVRFEDRSRNTWENEVNSMAMAAPKPGERWVLVTSAIHMPRAIGIARQLGWTMLPWPVGYSTLPSGGIHSDGQFARYLAEITTVVHEWIGLAGYRLTGRSAELFPAPEPEPATIDCGSQAFGKTG
jgi:uncharacterized SAM-binding protein YcdF (DUF218 family)